MSKIGSYDFAGEVQDDILRLMVKDHMFSGASVHWVKPEYFKGDARRWLARFVLDFVASYGVPPTAAQASTEAVSQAKYGKINREMVRSMVEMVPHIFKAPISGIKTYTLDLIQKFARYKAWEEAIVKALPHHSRGEMEEVDKIMLQAQNKAGDMDTDFYWYFESTAERVRRRGTGDDRPFLPTGILELDIHFRRGGVCPGEVALWMASKGRGKSIGLSHVTRRAIREGWKVAYYSFEMSTEQNADRLDAGFSGTSMWKLSEEQDQLFDKLQKLSKMYPKSLGIKQYPTKGRTIQDIRTHLETVRSIHGWQPNMIVIDYVSIVKPNVHRDKRHVEMQEILEDFRGLCVDFDCVGWTAAQINRSGAKKETVDGTDAAGSWDLLATADHIFTLNQTREEKQRGEIRIFIDKCRDGHSEFEIGPLYTDWEKMCFIRNSNKRVQDVRREFKERYQQKEEK